MGTSHAELKSVISNDLEWLSETFSDTKRRAVSLRQVSFLSFERVQWQNETWVRLMFALSTAGYLQSMQTVAVDALVYYVPLSRGVSACK